jgi:hypothetical protein
MDRAIRLARPTEAARLSRWRANPQARMEARPETGSGQRTAQARGRRVP